MRRNKVLCMLLAVVMLIGILAGCGSTTTTTTPTGVSTASNSEPTVTTQTAPTETAEFVSTVPAPIDPKPYETIEQSRAFNPEIDECVVDISAIIPEGYEFKKQNFKWASMNKEGDGGVFIEDYIAYYTELYTNGAVTFDIYYSGSLYSNAEGVECLGAGVSEFGNIHSANNVSYCPVEGMGYIFGFTSPDVLTVTKSARELVDNSQAWINETTSNNYKIIAINTMASYQIDSSVPTNNLNDLKGQIVGYAGSYFGAYLSAIGAGGIASTGPARYQDIQTGVYQGNLLSLDGTKALKIYEVAPYFYMCDLGAVPSIYASVNLDVWNSLDPVLQNLIEALGRQAELEYATRLTAWNKAAVNFFEEEGCTVVNITDEDKAEWASAIADAGLIDQWIADCEAQGIEGAAEAVSIYINAMEKNGFTFPFDTTPYKL